MASVFIGYVVGEDQIYAQTLQAELEAQNQTVEQIQLDWGDSLKEKFERYVGFMPGIIIISPIFLEIPWPQYELEELAKMGLRAMDNDRLVLIAWRGLSPESAPENMRMMISLPGLPADEAPPEAFAYEIIRQPIFEQAPMQKGYTLRGSGTPLSNSVALSQALSESFSEGELRDIAFDLGMDYGTLSGKGSTDKAHDLVINAQRKGMYEELRFLMQRRRPNMKM